MHRSIIAALAVLVMAPAAHGQAPDLILTGGKVFTADSARPWAEAVAIRGDRIVAVGSTAEISGLAGASTRRISLDGRVVIPGINDAHDHAGDAEFGVRFSADPSPMPDPAFAAVLDSVRAVAARTPAGTWIRATIGARILDDTAARRTALDRAAPRHPVLLSAWTGHGAVLNTAALRAVRIPESARDSAGGWYERDASGRLTGAMHEYAQWRVLQRLHSASPDSAIVASLQRYAAGAAAMGITSVQIMNGYLDAPTTVRVLRQARLPIRVRAIPFSMTGSPAGAADEWRGVERNPAPKTVISGVKWILDATPIDRNAAMRQAYADRPGWHGRLNFPPDTIRAILAQALASREQLMLHISGDSALPVLFSAMQSLAPDSVWRQLRVRIEHGDWLSGELLPVARRLGVVLVQNPTHLALDPDMLQARFGGAPAGLLPLRTVLAAGVPVAFGSDGPNNPFLNLMLATVHPTHPDEALTREQAVIAYTRGSAYAEFAEREKGTLAPGMLADLAVLSQDIFSVPPPALPGTTSVLTLVGGRIMHDELTRPLPRL
ncbi:amidohydrolase [Longimicrobium terrae]|uniref:Amidohydrolase 3 domain-containing protein n=1 Tax=Longimicrobium terrae TaxID=1639882 RepID=A0A841GVY6_9BACT|nr:amidohydrolase [Longimicrobium terrae]MBB4635380.1 hypothetical protein [Longimicrobium terrae]MBB6069774.1 hypothetical protein [Longimicrobium terrae]NNC31015.1 amidohydrolase [Longimicrobium terrae]